MSFWSKAKSWVLPAIGIALGVATAGASVGLTAALGASVGLSAATTGSFIGGATGLFGGMAASQVLGLGGVSKPKMPTIPEATIASPNIPSTNILTPAAPAPIRREDTGASVVLGSPTKDQRVSGGKSGIGKKVDVLGGLGLGGLRI